MSEVPAAVGFDRLPWLADDQPPRAPRSPRRPDSRAPRRELRVREWLGWAVAALLAVAGAAYWLGFRTAAQTSMDNNSEQLAAPVTVPLPGPSETPRTEIPTVVVDPAPRVAPIAATPPPVVKVEPSPRSAPAPTPQAKPKAAKAAPAASSKAQAIWPVRVEAGASGRMVRIGTFASRQQAKRGWARIMRLYPGMGRLPALVVAQPSLRDRRTYYRLQMGTTSQAHSEVLCQRMRMIAQSCVVVDLPARNRNSGARR